MGVSFEQLPWLVAPSGEALQHARELLSRLGALVSDSDITPLGIRMSRIPVHPRLARFVIASAEFGTTKEAAEIAARLSEGRLRLDEGQRKGFASDIEAMLGMPLWPNVARRDSRSYVMYRLAAIPGPIRTAWIARFFLPTRIALRADAATICCFAPEIRRASIEPVPFIQSSWSRSISKNE